jgi:hypothetical protein
MRKIYINGLFRTIMLERFLDGAVSESQVDGIKDSITRYCESKIDDLPLSEQEKEEQKRQMKQSAAAYNHGIKDGLRMVGKISQR